MKEHPSRKLAVILHADVVGSTGLVQRNETLAHARIRDAFHLLSAAIEAHGGVTREIRGDALVAEFARASDAIVAALAFQKENAEANTQLEDDLKPRLRAGISLGEVVIADNTVTGAGVVLAQRVEQLAKPDGVCITGAIHEAAPRHLDLAYEALGDQSLKGFDEPVRVYRVQMAARAERAPISPEEDQEVRFCETEDGVRIAYARVGAGPPLVKTANWMNHLEYDWESPVWRHMFQELASEHLLVRYDARGNGLSDWDVDQISFDAFVHDLEAVVDENKLENFALLGISQGCAVSVAYAVRHPDRVTHLVLYGGFVKGWRYASTSSNEKWTALNSIIRQGWGQDNPAFRQMFTSMFIPDATPEQQQWFNELQRISTSPENALRIREALADIDVTELLPKVSVPTLVLHARRDAVNDFEGGREFARGIPNARFVGLDSQNHLLIETEPAWSRFISEVRRFLNS